MKMTANIVSGYLLMSSFLLSVRGAILDHGGYQDQHHSQDHGGYQNQHQPQAPMPYEFGYGVNFPYTGDVKEHKELTSENGRTEGEYRWLQPNGLFRVVRYYVEGPSGFIAEVTEEEGAEVTNYVSNKVTGEYREPTFDNSYTQGGSPHGGSNGQGIHSTQGSNAYSGSQNAHNSDTYSGSQGFQNSGGFSESQNFQGSGGYSGSQSSQSSGRSSGSQNTHSSAKYSGSQNTHSSGQHSGSQSTYSSGSFSGSQNTHSSGKHSGSQATHSLGKYSGSQNTHSSGKYSGSQNSHGSSRYSGLQNTHSSGKFSGSQNMYGTSKHSGSQSLKGSSKYSGAQDFQTSQKFQGSQGFQSSRQGLQESTGFQNFNGFQGSNGFKNTQGFQSLNGKQASNGYASGLKATQQIQKGHQGLAKFQGSQPLQSHRGLQGANGYKSSRKSAAGAQGRSQHSTGLNGKTMGYGGVSSVSAFDAGSILHSNGKQRQQQHQQGYQRNGNQGRVNFDLPDQSAVFLKLNTNNVNNGNGYSSTSRGKNSQFGAHSSQNVNNIHSSSRNSGYGNGKLNHSQVSSGNGFHGTSGILNGGIQSGAKMSYNNNDNNIGSQNGFGLKSLKTLQSLGSNSLTKGTSNLPFKSRSSYTDHTLQSPNLHGSILSGVNNQLRGHAGSGKQNLSPQIIPEGNVGNIRVIQLQLSGNTNSIKPQPPLHQGQQIHSKASGQIHSSQKQIAALNIDAGSLPLSEDHYHDKSSEEDFFGVNDGLNTNGFITNAKTPSLPEETFVPSNSYLPPPPSGKADTTHNGANQSPTPQIFDLPNW